MRNGADYSVYINTGQVRSCGIICCASHGGIHHHSHGLYICVLKEFDGSDSGASPDEAISWGKIKIDASPVKVSADATLVFPLIVSQTFYKAFKSAL